MAVKNDPPYLRIVAEIRRRVAEGELAPGDRVPSTRQIARDWEVALATATKALATLRQEGLVEAEPRVGTVVAAARTARRRVAAEPDHELTRDRIVRAAVALADTEGLAALSMRGVAARLGVAAMSPYRYVTSKDDLVLLMADAVYGESAYPSAVDAPEGWRARLELGAHTLWVLHRRHPWLAHIGSLGRPLMLPNLMVHAEWALSALDGHGLGAETLMNLHVLVYAHVQGLAVHLEREAQAEAATGLSEDDWMERQTPALEALASSGAFPTFAKVHGSLGDGYDLKLDALFELGLTAMLDGLARVVEDPARG
ncbi:TetR/AcrR family transcriptional regulator C-terminal domain-containing protein [Streptomyces sp. H27-C3]|uniref:TetR/AcrR family transcriptional regulator C-terminal domain-containing protein n=1 Tax=Streptomyces sp. H27-C3 TaxID=3046305 RepID=UPI0024B881CD|nr:TetR/AcrR family transcriptional regulator C-terminal domain-containing protein [Streptomyces sp. H27-C3]MDJ0463572.1 TetR/AcrR family transcriptional regulator C-terminal domain-containing protein [Streptomyces sp. H27-C3]